MDSSLTAKITDFGLSKTKEILSTTSSSTTEIIGTIAWAPPENLTYKRISERGPPGDVYSFGVIAWELVSHQTPWQGFTREDVKEAVLEGVRLEIPKDCPKELKELMTLCWKNGSNAKVNIFIKIKDILKRPKFQVIVDFFEEEKDEEEMELLDAKKQLKMKMEELGFSEN